MTSLSMLEGELKTDAPTEQKAMPVVATIAGSDSSGGAGLQADLKTFNQLGTHGCSVVTAITAQDAAAVHAAEPVPESLLSAQLQELFTRMAPNAVKTGMLWNSHQVELVAEALSEAGSSVIVDPVLIASSGFILAQSGTKEAMVQRLIPYADLITPNIHEAHALIGWKTSTNDDELNDAYLEELTLQLLGLGCKAVLLKGGHRPGNFAQDFYADQTTRYWLTAPTLGAGLRSPHGTGCTLSAAIAACMAHGYSLSDSIVIGKSYVTQAIDRAFLSRDGGSFLTHSSWPEQEDYLPWITPTAAEGRERKRFAPLDHPIGFYPIVDSCLSLAAIITSGISYAQLRIKNLHGELLDEEIHKAVELARMSNCRLFINDYWQLALKHNAYGVHLGQDDCKTADLNAINIGGLRLGISTHCYEEVARALAFRPSYVAIGPIFETTTKVMRFAPQGIEALRRWRKSLNMPLVAIGGIFLDNAREVLATGIDSIAVVRDISHSSQPAHRAAQWQELFEDRR